MDRLFSNYDITGVIHFAGLKAVGESVEKPLLYYRNNLDSTLTVLEVMREHNCHQFVFSSSATVYGDQPAPLYETAQTGGCSNPYGWTKFMIEEILKGACRADPALSVVLLRYFNPIGAHESGLIGENPNGIPNNLMPYITQVAIGRRERLTVFGDDYDTPDGKMHLFCRVRVIYGEPMPAEQFAMENRRDTKKLRANKQALLEAWERMA